MTTGKKVLIGCAIALGVFVVAIAAIIAIALFATKGIADVADQQLAALRAGDYAKAYSYTSKDFQNSTSLEKFQEFVNAYPSLKNNESSFTPPARWKMTSVRWKARSKQKMGA